MIGAPASSKADVLAAKRERKAKPKSKRLLREEAALGTTWEVFREGYLRLHKYCAAFAEIPAGWCSEWATEIHHIIPRSQGGALMDDANCLASCHACHMHIHANPAEARRLGLSKGRYKT